MVVPSGAGRWPEAWHATETTVPPEALDENDRVVRLPGGTCGCHRLGGGPEPWSAAAWAPLRESRVGMLEHLVNLLLGVWTQLQRMVGRTSEGLLEQALGALQLGQLGGDALPRCRRCGVPRPVRSRPTTLAVRSSAAPRLPPRTRRRGHRSSARAAACRVTRTHVQRAAWWRGQPALLLSARTPARLSQGPSGLILGAFFLPRGLPGRLGGVLMARSPPQQREIADLLAAPGTELCEVGCGPVVAALLAQRHPQRRLHLVDPSPAMRSQAADRARQWQRAGRVDISAGTADQIPLPDAACDTVVAANTVVMWPDLAAGLREIRRVLRPRGRLVLSRRSASAPATCPVAARALRRRRPHAERRAIRPLR